MRYLRSHALAPHLFVQCTYPHTVPNETDQVHVRLPHWHFPRIIHMGYVIAAGKQLTSRIIDTEAFAARPMHESFNKLLFQ